MGLLGAKIGALTVICVLALLAGFLPIKLRKALFRSSKITEKYTLIILSASLCCGAGVLMATVFLHILKETREGFNEAMTMGYMHNTDYSIAELIMCCGFFLIYFLEEVVHLYVHKIRNKSQIEEDDPSLEFRRVSSINLRASIRASQRKARCSSLKEGQSPTCLEARGDPNHAQLHSSMQTNISSGGNNNDVKPRSHSPMKDLRQKPKPKPMEESLVRSFLVIIALSLHGAFEGLSVGLENSASNVWLLCAALSAHKLFIAFSIGMEMLEEGVNIMVYSIHMLIFSLASPIGGALGLTLTASLENNNAGFIAITVLKGVSGGTILYVTFCEVLERERTKPSGRFFMLFALVLGFSIMAGLQAAALEHKHFDNDHYNVTEPPGHDHSH